mgnify:CR=1 FL=1
MLTELKLKLMADKQSNFSLKNKIKTLGIAAFLFFLIKGILWLVIGGSLISFFVSGD